MYDYPMNLRLTISPTSTRIIQRRCARLRRKLASAKRVEAAASAKVESARSQGRISKIRRLERSWFRKSLRTQKFRDLCVGI